MDQQIRMCTAADGVSIAYATAGDGPPLVKAANWLSHLEFDWQSPVWSHLFEDLAKDFRLVRYDERGTGLSDRDVEDLSFDAWVRDLESVVDALALDRFILLGISQGGAVAIAYAARHPDRVSHLVLLGTYPRGWQVRGAESDTDTRQALITLIRDGWGSDNPAFRQLFTTMLIPGANQEQMQWFNDLQRISASPENAARIYQEFGPIDVQDLLPQIATPALVLHSREDAMVPFESGRYVAAHLPGAQFVPLESRNHLLLKDEPAYATFLAEVRRFLAGAQPPPGADATARAVQSLRTLLFTDLESSTALSQAVGDERAQEVLRGHNDVVRAALAAHDGEEVKHTGDGIFAAFGSAVSAVEAALQIQRDLAGAEVRVRIGLNAGEPIAEEGDYFGAAVQLAARVCDRAEPGQVLVPSVVRDLCRGKRFQFADQGEATLKGFPEPVRLFVVGEAE